MPRRVSGTLPTWWDTNALTWVTAIPALVAPAVARADDSLRDSPRYLREAGRHDYPFVGSTKAMTIAINTQFRADSQLHAAAGRGWACKVGFKTTLIVSWRCQDDEAHRGQDLAINAAYEVVGDTLKPLTFDDVFPPGLDRDARLAKLKGDLGKQDSAEAPHTDCSVPATRGAIYLTPSWGLEVLARADSPSGCFFWYPKIVPLLQPQSRIGIVAAMWASGPWNTLQTEPRELESDEPGYIPLVNIPPGKTLPNRFVALDKDSVRDTGTSLVSQRTTTATTSTPMPRSPMPRRIAAAVTTTGACRPHRNSACSRPTTSLTASRRIAPAARATT